MAAENEAQNSSVNGAEKIKQKNGVLHVKCPFCSTWIPHNKAISEGCACGASVESELKYTTAGKVMHLDTNTDRGFARTEKTNGEMLIQGPFCDAWVSVSDLENGGCECGATVTIDVSFKE